MVFWLIQQLLYARRAVQAESATWQIALGCTLGMVLGIIPKGNLIAISLTVIVLAIRLNLGAAMLSTLLFSLVGRWLDPITHPIGVYLLSADSLQTTWKRLYDLPMAPWTSFNNSVVLGSVVLGILVSIPFYLLTHWATERWKSRSRAVEIAGFLTGPVNSSVSSPA